MCPLLSTLPAALAVRAEIPLGDSDGTRQVTLAELHAAAPGNGLVPRVAVATLDDDACYPDLGHLLGVCKGYSEWAPTLSEVDGDVVDSFAPAWEGMCHCPGA